MLIAALRDTSYNFVLFLHVLTVIIAMAGAVANPIMFAAEERRADGDVVRLAQRMETPSRVFTISFALTGIIGFGLVTMGDWPWGETWIWISILLWVVGNGLLHAAVIPAERAIASGDAGAMVRYNRFGGVMAVVVLALLIMMTMKPGGSAL